MKKNLEGGISLEEASKLVAEGKGFYLPDGLAPKEIHSSNGMKSCVLAAQ